jgi:hypothetical protein
MSWIDGRTLHHNLENIIPAALRPAHMRYGNKFLIYRDFDDWIASTIMKSYKKQPTRNLEDIPIYIDTVTVKYWAIRAEAENPHYFKANAVIHYDEFFQSREYRQTICDVINGNYNEDKIDFVPKNGNASSFNGKKYDGKGSKMNVLNRAGDILKTEHAEFFNKIMEKYGRRI